MKKKVIQTLYENRLLLNGSEIELFEQSLNELANVFDEDDIIELCNVLDDKTMNSEVMFEVLHLLETLSSEKAYRNTIKGVTKLKRSSPEWAKIILYRCLNDLDSVEMIKKIYSKLEIEIKKEFYELLIEIQEEDAEKFGEAITEIVL